MRQIEILFPPPFTDRQLAGAAGLERIVERERATFRCQDYARRRRAAKQSKRGEVQ